MHVHICIFSLISVVSPLETIKQESQNPVKATVIKEKKINSILSRNRAELFSVYKKYKSCFNMVEFKEEKSDASLNFRLYMIRYRVCNYCVYIYIYI